MKPYVCAIIMTCILLSGCSGLESITSGSHPDTVETLPSISNVKPRTPTPTSTQTPTATTPPTETFTPSPSPTTPAPTATWMIPTLGVRDPAAIKRLDTIPSGQEGCLPPCWNGITPGVSPASDIPAFLAQFGIAYSEKHNLSSGEDSNLQKTKGSLHEMDTNLRLILLWWQENVEVMLLWYYGNIDLYGEASFLHPKNLIENIGIPDSAKISIHETWGNLFIVFSEYGTAITYGVEVIENMSGESKLCLVQPKYDPDIQAIFYAESYDPYNFFLYASAEFEDQAFFTGLTLQDFLTELAIPGRCIPVQIPD